MVSVLVVFGGICTAGIVPGSGAIEWYLRKGRVDEEREMGILYNQVADQLQGLIHEAVSYTHLTLPTNREV